MLQRFCELLYLFSPPALGPDLAGEVLIEALVQSSVELDRMEGQKLDPDLGMVPVLMTIPRICWFQKCFQSYEEDHEIVRSAYIIANVIRDSCFVFCLPLLLRVMISIIMMSSMYASVVVMTKYSHFIWDDVCRC